MYSNNEVIIKIIGKATLALPELNQLKLRDVLEEVLYNYDVITKEKALISSDIEEKMHIYIACKRLDGLAETTLSGYVDNINIFAKFMKKPVATITTMDLRMFLSVRCKNLMATSTNTQVSMLKSFFSWLTEEEYIPKNPTTKLKHTKVPKVLRHPLSDEEVENLRQSCKSDREKALIEFLVSTGCRLSEVLQINLNDIDWNDMSLFIIGKGSKERKVYFTVKAKILLKKYIKNRKGSSEALFLGLRYPFNRLGDRAVEVEINNIAKRANFDKSVFPHLFRHSYATHNLNAGMPIPVLQKLMGHSSCDTTMIYAELNEDNIKHAYKMVS